MSDNTIIRPKQPRFGINEIVYLRESALLGYLEHAKVYRVRFDPDYNKNFYVFLYKKSKPNTQIAGDAIDLKSSKIIEIIEDEIISYQEALIIKFSSLESELLKTKNQLAASDGFPNIDVAEQGTDITAPLDYGDVNVGTLKRREYEILNDGMSDLVLSGVLLFGDDDFLIDKQPDLVIPPNNSSVFIVRFAPSSVGRKVGVVQIPNNVPSLSVLSYTIEGTGT